MAESIVSKEISDFFRSDDRLAGEIFRLMELGTTEAKALVEKSSAANVGVISNNKQVIACLIDNKLPRSANIANYALQAIKRLRNYVPNVSNQTLVYIDNLQAELQKVSLDNAAREHDQQVIERGSEVLAAKATEYKNAIYVYSFPTYLHFGTIEDSELKWLKIGSSRNAVWQRVVEQNRQTSMPEDPVLIRVYHKADMNPIEIEAKFHKTLDKVGHARSSAIRTRAGKEWFATTEEALDALADLMQLTIESNFEF